MPREDCPARLGVGDDGHSQAAATRTPTITPTRADLEMTGASGGARRPPVTASYEPCRCDGAGAPAGLLPRNHARDERPLRQSTWL